MISKLNSYPKTWEEAIPLGNGTIGALMMARCEREEIIATHENIFLPMDGDVEMPDLTAEMNEARDRIRRGEMRAAQDIFFDSAIRKFAHAPTNGKERFYPDPFVPAMKIDICVPGAKNPQRESAVLDFETACARIEWRDGETWYTRDCFVSYPNRIGVVRLQSSGEAVYEIGVSAVPVLTERDRFLHDGFVEGESSFAEGNTVRYTCCFKKGGGYRAFLQASGGNITTEGQRLNVTGKDILLRYVIVDDLKQGFDFSGFSDNYDALLQAHVSKWQKEYGACSLSFGAEALANLPNEDILAADTDEKRRACYERMYAFGRYAMLSDFGHLPPNAQGVWNGTWSSVVFGDYVLNIEMEMAYFPAFACGGSRCLSALIHLIRQYMPGWRENAQKMYGAKGFLVACRSTNSGRLTHFSKPFPMEFWITGGAWIAGILYDAFRVNRDMQYLKDEAFPFMVEAAEFFMDVYETGTDGKLVLLPGMSPENEPFGVDTMVSRNVTMDITMLKQLFTNLTEAAIQLQLPSDDRWQSFLSKLPDYRYNADGSLCEWADAAFEDKNAHRHLSHLYAAYPGEEALMGDKGLYRGSRIALKKRLHEGMIKYFCGWSIGHAACAAARMGLGEECMLLLDRLLAEYVNSNLFTTLDPGRHYVQIDANHAFVAAMHEMLIYSRENRIRVLPGFNSVFSTGCLSGISLVGGRKLNMLAWNLEKGEVELEFTTKTSQDIEIEFPQEILAARLNGEELCTRNRRSIDAHPEAGVPVTVFVKLRGHAF